MPTVLQEPPSAQTMVWDPLQSECGGKTPVISASAEVIATADTTSHLCLDLGWKEMPPFHERFLTLKMSFLPLKSVDSLHGPFGGQAPQVKGPRPRPRLVAPAPPWLPGQLPSRLQPQLAPRGSGAPSTSQLPLPTLWSPLLNVEQGVLRRDQPWLPALGTDRHQD